MLFTLNLGICAIYICLQIATRFMRNLCEIFLTILNCEFFVKFKKSKNCIYGINLVINQRVAEKT